MRIVAFDQGNETGFAVFDVMPGRRIKVLWGSILVPSDESVGMRYDRFQKALKVLLPRAIHGWSETSIRRNHPITGVYFEDVRGRKWNTSFHTGLQAMIQLHFKEVPKIEAAPAPSWKKIATGNGRAGKEETAKTLAERFHRDPRMFSEHIWDAIGIGLWGLKDQGIDWLNHSFSFAPWDTTHE